MQIECDEKKSNNFGKRIKIVLYYLKIFGSNWFYALKHLRFISNMHHVFNWNIFIDFYSQRREKTATPFWEHKFTHIIANRLNDFRIKIHLNLCSHALYTFKIETILNGIQFNFREHISVVSLIKSTKDSTTFLSWYIVERLNSWLLTLNCKLYILAHFVCTHSHSWNTWIDYSLIAIINTLSVFIIICPCLFVFGLCSVNHFFLSTLDSSCTCTRISIPN